MSAGFLRAAKRSDISLEDRGGTPQAPRHCRPVGAREILDGSLLQGLTPWLLTDAPSWAEDRDHPAILFTPVPYALPGVVCR